MIEYLFVVAEWNVIQAAAAFHSANEYGSQKATNPRSWSTADIRYLEVAISA